MLHRFVCNSPLLDSCIFPCFSLKRASQLSHCSDSSLPSPTPSAPWSLSIYCVIFSVSIERPESESIKSLLLLEGLEILWPVGFSLRTSDQWCKRGWRIEEGMGTGGTAMRATLRSSLGWNGNWAFLSCSTFFFCRDDYWYNGFKKGLRTQAERVFPATFWRGLKQSTQETSETQRGTSWV